MYLFILIPVLLACLCPLPPPAGQWIGVKLAGMCINPLMQTVVHTDTSGQKLHRVNWSHCCCRVSPPANQQEAFIVKQPEEMQCIYHWASRAGHGHIDCHILSADQFWTLKGGLVEEIYCRWRGFCSLCKQTSTRWSIAFFPAVTCCGKTLYRQHDCKGGGCSWGGSLQASQSCTAEESCVDVAGTEFMQMCTFFSAESYI